MPAPRLHVDAELRLARDQHEIRIHAAGGRLFVDFPAPAAWRAWRARPARARRRRWLGSIDRVLRRAGLTAHLRVGRRELARYGAGTTPGWSARLLGLHPAEVSR